MGCPIIGDELYGNKEEDNILHLHSYHINFKHPISEKIVDIITYPIWYKDMI